MHVCEQATIHIHIQIGVGVLFASSSRFKHINTSTKEQLLRGSKKNSSYRIK